MSPRPPPLIYPRTTLPPSSSTMAESPRPLPSTAFSHPQLPPPIFGTVPGTTQRFSGPGPVLAPLAILSSGSGGSTLQPPAQQLKSPTHIPTQHPLPQHIPSPLQTPHKLEPRRVPYGIIPSQPSFNSPTPSGFSSPGAFNLDQRYGFSSEPDRGRRYASC